MRITVIFKDDQKYEYDASAVVIETWEPVLIASNTAHELIVMEKGYEKRIKNG